MIGSLHLAARLANTSVVTIWPKQIAIHQRGQRVKSQRKQWQAMTGSVRDTERLTHPRVEGRFLPLVEATTLIHLGTSIPLQTIGPAGLSVLQANLSWT